MQSNDDGEGDDFVDLRCNKRKNMNTTINKTIYRLIFITTTSLTVLSCTKNNSNETQTSEGFSKAANNIGKEQSSVCGIIPQDLAVPRGNKLVMQTYATGVQIYQVRRNAVDPNVFEWINIAPSSLSSPLINSQVGPL